MSRLLTLLLLYQSGFIVGKYISIERIIEESKETYYEVLQDSSINWHENENDYKPFVNYMLGVVVNAYKEFESRVELLTNPNLSRDNFAVRQHLKYVELYSTESNYQTLTYEDTLIVKEEVAPLILPDGEDASAVRFDALMYGIELAYLVGKKYSKARTDLYKKVTGIASVANIPEIQAQSKLINKILDTDYVDNAGINEFEEIREQLRDLMKYLPHPNIRYDTNFTDEILSTEWNESELENDELKNYKAKAEYYIRQHQDNIAIARKLR